MKILKIKSKKQWIYYELIISVIVVITYLSTFVINGGWNLTGELALPIVELSVSISIGVLIFLYLFLLLLNFSFEIDIVIIMITMILILLAVLTKILLFVFVIFVGIVDHVRDDKNPPSKFAIISLAFGTLFIWLVILISLIH